MVMRTVLVQLSFTLSQVFGFEVWKEALEMRKPHQSAPTHNQYELKISCCEEIIELHYAHAQELEALQLDYVRQVAMWGFECSKTEPEWDQGFIARRKLELAQLNRTTKRLALRFEQELQAHFEDPHLFSSLAEKKCLLDMVEKFRDSFGKGVEIADKETAAIIKKPRH